MGELPVGGDSDPDTDIMVVLLVIFGLAGMGGPCLFLLLLWLW